MRHYRSNPLDDGTCEKFSFDDITVLTLIGAVSLLMGFVFLLGMFCATHRIEAAISML